MFPRVEFEVMNIYYNDQSPLTCNETLGKFYRHIVPRPMVREYYYMH